MSLELNTRTDISPLFLLILPVILIYQRRISIKDGFLIWGCGGVGGKILVEGDLFALNTKGICTSLFPSVMFHDIRRL